METGIHCRRRTLPIVGQLAAHNAKQLMLLIVVIEALSIFPTLCGNYVKVFY